MIRNNPGLAHIQLNTVSYCDTNEKVERYADTYARDNSWKYKKRYGLSGHAHCYLFAAPIENSIGFTNNSLGKNTISSHQILCKKRIDEPLTAVVK